MLRKKNNFSIQSKFSINKSWFLSQSGLSFLISFREIRKPKNNPEYPVDPVQNNS
jgi:hypothetical protein